MSAEKPRLVPLPAPDVEDADVRDFRDPESQQVLDAAARAVARELGRQYARELHARVRQ